MTPTELQSKLTEFLSLPAETEWLEFKEAKSDKHFDDIGEYFSALSNEANLKGQPFGWLVFGVKDKPVPRQIVGSRYRPQRPHLDSLKEEIANHTSHRLTFEEIHEVTTPDGRVVMFQIPAALRGSPTSWRGHFYGRDHENLCALNLHEIEQIRKQALADDWSAVICEEATLSDLEPNAIAFARQEFVVKNSTLEAEVATWDDTTFLNKAKVCISGKLTRTAIILLGRPEAQHFLGNCHPQLTWILKDKDGLERDYQHFHSPLLLAVDPLLRKIRNLTCRVLPWGTLFPTEILQYEPWVLRESLHNAIAHQDYSQGGRVDVVEFEDRLVVVNKGTFLPGDVESVIRRDAPYSLYRNAFLAQAMVGLGMIDTVGSGIKRIFQAQKKRSFPMPDYDFSTANEVKLVIQNSVLDERYTRMLMARADLSLWDVIALDKVQKNKPLTESEFKAVKTKRLIEGRRPNLFVSAEVAAATDDKEAYIRNRAFDKDYYKDLVKKYLSQYEEASRPQIDRLLQDKLSDALDEKQKKQFVTNLLQEMKRDGTVVADGTTRWAKWRMSKTDADAQN
ncbi:RNA-binding domain-containing protein [Stieleria varia]|uniref:Divergent AAA domain protein n=1 Tax=Stieleria varia TaxID=2528005 RepID=A0A5C6AQ99_9BACT|nr:RNA-binding domain-containing protein [Stieleria varia]TWU02223.1 Divergent AAA domain protein [Stieleria varia]